MSRINAHARKLSRMIVPGIASVRPGIGVNIILKADQRSGKLTQGRVQDLLTRGDHPRGIKVRLQDGQIGRVQSLSSVSAPAPATTSYGSQNIRQDYAEATANARSRVVHLQDDYRNDPVPAENRSLEDYVTIKPAKTKRKGGMKRAVDTGSEQAIERSPQEMLQHEFPRLDSALIAAILSDTGSADEAKKVLMGLS